jgi:RHS repeat-associated protein
VAPTYDSKGNLAAAGGATYSYSSENLLTSASGGITLSYDAAMRLYQTAGGTPGTTRFQYDGAALLAEYNSSNSLQRRYVHGAGTNESVAWYEGSSTSDRRFLHADERGSVASVTSSAATSVNTYDEYGIPRSSNIGRFQYTGQTWLPELGMFYYKARIYSPTLGRFMQTDPIGTSGGMNLYLYAGANPVGFNDPMGLERCAADEYLVIPDHRNEAAKSEGGVIVVTAPPYQCVNADWLKKNVNFDGTIYGPPVYGQKDPPPPDPQQEWPSCPASGPVVFGGPSAEGYLGRGLGRSGGLYRDMTTGETGVFGSKESGWGWGAALGGQFGVATDMKDFRGDYGSLGLGVGLFGFNYTYKPGHFFRGTSLALTLGINVMPAPPGIEPGSAHLSEGTTTATPFSGALPRCK